MRKISLFQFFIITTVLTATVIFAELSIVVMREYRRTLLDSAMLNTEQVTRQTANTLDIYMREMKDNLKLLNRELQNSVSRNDASEYLHSMVKIQTKLSTVVVFDENGQLLECGVDNILLRGDIFNNSSFLPAQFETRPFEPSFPHEQNMLKGIKPQVITLGVRLTPNVYKKTAYLAADFLAPNLLSFIDSIAIGTNGYCFVTDATGKLIYSPPDKNTDVALTSESYLNNGNFTADNRFISIAQINSCNWRIVGVSYTDEMINQKIFDMERFIFFSIMLCIPLIILSALVFFRNVHMPLKALSDDIASFGRETLSSKKRMPSGVSEVRELSELFDQMAERVRELTERIKNDENSLRKTELRALQAQINPHFLYNTLDSIQWMCERGETKLAVNMIGALAKLFRISISKGQEMIPISREIEHAKSYLIIQGYRFRNNFSYRFDIDHQILDFLCNKITLQPIIENAIIHGFGESADNGEIIIIGQPTEDGILLTVKDNGVGMSEKALRNILSATPSSDFGIGLRNINERIKIYFGDNYGLSVESTEGEGTTVRVFLPKIT